MRGNFVFFFVPFFRVTDLPNKLRERENTNTAPGSLYQQVKIEIFFFFSIFFPGAFESESEHTNKIYFIKFLPNRIGAKR